MPEIFTVFSEFKEFRFYFGIFFFFFDFCFVLVLVSMFCCHTHLSTSSSWQTEVQDKTLLAWSWHVLCTVESLDLAMLDDPPSPRTRGQGGLAKWAQGVESSSSA